MNIWISIQALPGEGDANEENNWNNWKKDKKKISNQRAKKREQSTL